MSDITYVILNGPPHVGKTEISKNLISGLNSRSVRYLVGGGGTVGSVAIGDSFAAPMKHFIAVALAERYQHMDKERSRSELNGYSVRQSLIDMSENYLKKRYGQDVFGRWLVHRSLRHPIKPTFVIVDDGGFIPEILACPRRFVVRISRPGKSFVGDSRGYYPTPDYIIDNARDLGYLWVAVRQLQERLEEMER